MQTIKYYTDGSGSPGLGDAGWAFVRVVDGEATLKASGHLRMSTNNRAELTAIIEAVAATPSNCHVEIHTDSELCIKIAGGEYTAKKNVDLWQEFRALCRNREGTVNFIKVKAHSGDKFNDMADRLAGAARGGVTC